MGEDQQKRPKDVLFIEWCARDALDGTLQLSPMVELAYRRILDMIYATEDNLVDDDSVLPFSTKTGSKWKSIKRELIDVHKKIYVENGFIRNKKCTEKLQKVDKILGQKSKAGKISAEKRKSLKNNNTGSTAVENVLAENVNTSSTNQEPRTKKERKTPLPPKTTPPHPAGSGSFKSLGSLGSGLVGSSSGFDIRDHLQDDDWLLLRDYAPLWGRDVVIGKYNAFAGSDPPKKPVPAFTGWLKKNRHWLGKSP